MKILVVHNFYQQRGGEDAVVESETQMLRERGHEVALFAVHNDSIQGWRGKVVTALLSIYNPWAKAKLARKLREFRPDVVHVHNFFPKLSPSIFDACREARIPSVMTLHNFRILCPTMFLYHDKALRERSLTHSSFWAVRERTYRSSYLGTFFVACMVDFHKWAGTWRRKVDLFIALTNFAKEKFIQGGLPPERIVVKSNAIADPAHGPDGDVARRGGLYVGRLSPEKGIETLLTAWTDVDYPLRIAGDGPLRQMCERAQGKEVTYLGRLNKEQVYAEMKRAAFLILPSVWYEMFPVTLLESYASELPVIASRLGGLISLLSEGVTGLAFEAAKPHDLRRNICWAIDNPDKVHEMGVQARSVYERAYTTEVNYLNLMQIYDRVLKTRTQPPLEGEKTPST